ncbi:electron transfer flavoprotein subunit beta/FixA family protein [bacterium AH-315-C07]|nr:electron transfer flavoprotein subunit beta/FixA family protein [bacterium AH-315-C07]
MKLLVCISVTPDTTSKISFNSDNTEFNADGIQFIINPYDEIALSRAVELRDATGGSLTVVNVGELDAEPNIRKALAIGADEAVRINAKPADAFTVASHIANYAKDQGFDAILCGEETINYNGAQVPSMVGELLGIPSILSVKKLEIEGGTGTVDREIDGGKESLSVPCPFVISAQEGMAEPRIPNMRGIMSARSKPLNVVEPETVSQAASITSYELPPAKGECKYVDPENVKELVDLLHNEAKAI